MIVNLQAILATLLLYQGKAKNKNIECILWFATNFTERLLQLTGQKISQFQLVSLEKRLMLLIQEELHEKQGMR